MGAALGNRCFRRAPSTVVDERCVPGGGTVALQSTCCKEGTFSFTVPGAL